MKGTNILTLCHAEMVAAVEHYLNDSLFRLGKGVTVQSVDYDRNANVFDVKIMAADQETEETDDGE